MSDSSSGGCSLTLGVWFVMFVLIKVAGTALASWSWLWILFPIVPDLYVILHHFQML